MMMMMRMMRQSQASGFDSCKRAPTVTSESPFTPCHSPKNVSWSCLPSLWKSHMRVFFILAVRIERPCWQAWRPFVSASRPLKIQCPTTALLQPMPTSPWHIDSRGTDHLKKQYELVMSETAKFWHPPKSRTLSSLSTFIYIYHHLPANSTNIARFGVYIFWEPHRGRPVPLAPWQSCHRPASSPPEPANTGAEAYLFSSKLRHFHAVYACMIVYSVCDDVLTSSYIEPPTLPMLLGQEDKESTSINATSWNNMEQPRRLWQVVGANCMSPSLLRVLLLLLGFITSRISPSSPSLFGTLLGLCLERKLQVRTKTKRIIGRGFEQKWGILQIQIHANTLFDGHFSEENDDQPWVGIRRTAHYFGTNPT